LTAITQAAFFAVIAAVLGLVYQVWFCRRPPSSAKTVIKTLSVALLALVAVFVDAPIWLILALVFCAFGDMFLSRDGEQNFLFGLVSFAIGHVFYILTFLKEPRSDVSIVWDIPWILLAFFLIALGVVMAKVLWSRTGNLRGPVAAYSAIIVLMGLSALSLNSYGLSLVFIGATMFIISDIILSVELFLVPEDHPVKGLTSTLIWMFYWLGQATILTGVGLF
jgi:uncharacterized membrane protein YhhN